MLKRLFGALLGALLLCALHASAQQNFYGVALASAARTAATVNSADITNTSYRGAHFIINVTSWTSGTYTPVIQGKSPLGTYYTILQGAAGANTVINTALCSSGCTIVMKVYPTAGAITNAASADILPYQWRVQMVGASTPSATFSVSYLSEQ